MLVTIVCPACGKCLVIEVRENILDKTCSHFQGVLECDVELPLDTPGESERDREDDRRIDKTRGK